MSVTFESPESFARALPEEKLDKEERIFANKIRCTSASFRLSNFQFSMFEKITVYVMKREEYDVIHKNIDFLVDRRARARPLNL